MSKKRKKDEVDLLEGFDFDAVLAGEVRGPEALVPEHISNQASAIEAAPINARAAIDNSIQDQSPQIDVVSSPTIPGENPYKTRINPVDGTRINPVQNPYKSRTKKKSNFSETRIPTRISKSQDPYKTRIRPVYPSKSVQTLAGKQKDAFFFLLLDAKENGNTIENGDRITSQVSSARLAEASRTNDYNGTRAITNALKKAQLLLRYQTKNGPGGWTVYRIPKTVYLEGLNYLSRINTVEEPYKSRINPVHQPVYKPVQTVSSSSRDLYLSNSTTTQNVDNSNAEWLETLDLSHLKSFGITRDTIARAFQLNPELKLEQVEDLVFRFGQFAADPKNRVQNARGFFLDLAKQAATGLTPLDHIETPRERMLREFVEKSEAKRARLLALEQAAFDFEFDAWILSLTSEDRDQIIPPQGIIESGSFTQTMKLKEYFRTNLWPDRRKQIEQGEVSL